MPSPHLAAGAKQPPKVSGIVRLYSVEYCPYVQRVRLVLNAKNIPYEIVNINIDSKPDWYFKMHPEGKVPSLDTGSEVLIESLDISNFLNEKYPGKPLYPKDPEAKKHDQELAKETDIVGNTFIKYFFRQEERSFEEWEADFAHGLKHFEQELAKRGKFFGGSTPGMVYMVDYMLWPWIERSFIVPIEYGEDLLSEEKYPLLRKWREAMLEDLAVTECYYKPQVHLRIILQKRNKQIPDYDNILNEV